MTKEGQPYDKGQQMPSNMGGSGLPSVSWLAPTATLFVTETQHCAATSYNVGPRHTPGSPHSWADSAARCDLAWD